MNVSAAVPYYKAAFLKLLFFGCLGLVGIGAVFAAAVYAAVPLCFDSAVRQCLLIADENFTGEVLVDKASFDWHTLRLDKVRLRLDSGEELVSLDSAELDLNWSRALSNLDYMSVLGDVRLEGLEASPAFDEQGNFNFAQLKSLKPEEEKPPFPWEDYASRCDSHITLNDGSVMFRDLRRGNFCARLDRLKFAAFLTPGSKAEFNLGFIPVQQVNSENAEPGKVALSGSIALQNAPDFAAELSVERFNLARLTDYWELPQGYCLQQAELNSSLWVRCLASSWSETLNKLSYGGSLKVDKGMFSLPQLSRPLTHIGCQVEILPGMAVIKNAGVNFAGTGALAEGKVYVIDPIANGKNVQGRVHLLAKVPRLNIRKITEALDIKVPVNGLVKTEITVDGPLLNPSASGHLSSAKISYEDKNLEDLRADFSWKNNMFSLDSLTARAVGGRVEGTGCVLLGNGQPQIALNLSGIDLNLNGISPVGGRIGRFDVAMVGTPKDPLVYGSGSGIGGFSGQASMLQSASGSFMYSNKMVSLSGARASTSMGSASVPYAWADLQNPFVYALLNADNFTIPTVSIPTIGNLSGTVSAQAEIMGVPTDMRSLSVVGFSRSSDIRLGSLDIRGLHGLVGLDDMNVLVPYMQGSAAGGSVAASGWVGLGGGTSNVSLEASGVDIAAMMGILPYDIPLALNGRGNLGACWYTPELGGENWIMAFIDGRQNYVPSVVGANMAAVPENAVDSADSEAVSLTEEAAAAASQPGSGEDPNPAPTPLAVLSESRDLVSGGTAEMAAASVASDEPGAGTNSGLWVKSSAGSVSGQSSEGLALSASEGNAALKKAADGLTGKFNASEAGVRPVSASVSQYAVAPDIYSPELASISLGRPCSYSAAASGRVGGGGRFGFLGWASGLALDGRRLTSDLSLSGRLTGRFGVWGNPQNVKFGYFASLADSPITGTTNGTLWASGLGGFSNGTISLSDNLAVWQYDRPAIESEMPRLEGQSYAFIGPELAPPLRRTGTLASYSPSVGALKLNGTVALGKVPDYDLDIMLSDVDLGWLHDQDWLPIAAQLMDASNIGNGRASVMAKIRSAGGYPYLAEGSWAEIPWFSAGNGSGYHTFSASGALSTGVNTVNGKSSFGRLSIDRMLISNMSSDARLPKGQDVRSFNLASLDSTSGLLDIHGSIDSGRVNVFSNGKDWDTRQAMAFLPASVSAKSKINGLLDSENLEVSFDINKGVLSTLAMDGRMSLRGGSILAGGSSIPIENVSAEVHRNADMLVFSDISLVTGGLMFKGSGMRDSAGRIRLNVFSDDIPFSSLTRISSDFEDLSGSVRMALNVESEDPQLKAIKALFALEGRDVVFNSIPVSIAFPDFRAGKWSEDSSGAIKVDEASGISVKYNDGVVDVFIPKDSLKVSAYRFFDTSMLSEDMQRRLRDVFTEETGREAPEPALAENSGSNDENDAAAVERGSVSAKKAADSQFGFRPMLALDANGSLIGARLDKEPMVMGADGSVKFGLGFDGGTYNWFKGEQGPDFGSASAPFSLSLENFHSNLIMAALGLPMSQRQFSFSGAAGLKGQWYRGHLLNSDPGSLAYDFNVSEMSVGSVTNSESDGIGSKDSAAAGKEEKSADKSDGRRKLLWRGLTLKKTINGSYRREDRSGRLIIEPFEFVPDKHTLAAGGKKEEIESESDGRISGSANLAIMREYKPRLANGTRNTSSRTDVNELYLNISKVPMSELGSFLIPGGFGGGFVNNFILNASGSPMAPSFNMLVDTQNGSIYGLKLASITGAVSGSRDPETRKYSIRFGTINSALRNKNMQEVVNKGIDEVISSNPEAFANGLRVYFGDTKREDRVFSLSGSLPYDVVRNRPVSTDSLLPFWTGTEVSMKGDIDINAALKDQDLGIISSMLPDVSKSSGRMEGMLHVGGTIEKPDVTGAIDVRNGAFTHAKLGDISALNVDADFTEINDQELKSEYTDRKIRALFREHGAGAAMAELMGSDASIEQGPENAEPSEEEMARLKAEFEKKRADFVNQNSFNRITVKHFDAMLGDRPFTLSGQTDLDGVTPMAVDFTLKGDQLPLRWGSLFGGRADVNLHLGNADEPDDAVDDASSEAGKTASAKAAKLCKLSGDINVPSGDISVDLDMLTSSSDGEAFDWSKLPVDYNININIGDDVWMHALGCRLRAGGTLAIVPDSKSGQPVLDGSLDLSRGLFSMPLYDATFKVRSGKAVFSHSQIPELRDVQANTSISGYEVTAYINGSYPDISVEFVSNPPLAQEEVQRLLAIGSFSKYTPSANKLPNDYSSSMGGRAVSSDVNLGSSGISMISKLVSAPLTQEISRILFLSDLSLDVSSPHGYTLSIAKAIDSQDKFLFTLTRSLNSQTGQDESIYGVEWRFKPNMLFRLGFDQNGQMRPWFQGFWEF